MGRKGKKSTTADGTAVAAAPRSDSNVVLITSVVIAVVALCWALLAGAGTTAASTAPTVNISMTVARNPLDVINFAEYSGWFSMEREGVHVKAIKNAAGASEVRVGDRIVRVGAEDVTNFSLADLRAKLDSISDFPVTLHFRDRFWDDMHPPPATAADGDMGWQGRAKRGIGADIHANGELLPPSRGVRAIQIGGSSEKYLWYHTTSPMGFGDRMRIYFYAFWHARQTGRTFVMPPLHFTQRLYDDNHELQNMQMQKILREHPNDAKQYIKSVVTARKTFSSRQNRFIPLSAVFDRENLAKEVPVIEYDEWLNRTGGHVDVAIVPGKDWHSKGCAAPEERWASQCSKQHAEGGTKRALVRWDRPVIFDQTTCLDDSLAAKSASTIKREMLKNNHGPKHADVKPVLDHYAGATTLGIEGFCHGPSFFQVGDMHNYDNEEHEIALHAFRFNKDMEKRARNFVRAQGVKKYIAVHWRHGDLSYMAPEFMVPEALVTEVKEYLKLWDESYGAKFKEETGNELVKDIDGLLLMTDNFMRKDIQRFKEHAAQELGLKVFSFPNEHPVEATFMDVMLGMQAHMFLFSNAKSFFSTHILMNRLRVYKVNTMTNIDMQINSEFITDQIDGA